MTDQKEKQQVEKDLTTFSQEYLLPYNAETERFVLGGMILDQATRLRGISLCASDDFHVAAYRHTFNALLELMHSGLDVTPISIAEVMRRQGFLEQINGVAGITDLVHGQSAIDARTIQQYAQTLRDLTIKRKAFATAKKIAFAALDITVTSDAILDQAESDFSLLRNSTSTRSTLKTYKQVADETRAEIETWRHHETTAISTGIPELDKRLWAHGLARGELYYVGAITSMGKTALVLQILDAILLRGMRSLMFSMEMSAIMLMLRSIRRLSNGIEVSPYTIRDINPGDDPKKQKRKRYADYAYMRACQLLNDISKWRGIVDDETTDWQSIKAKARQAHKDEPLDFIAGDYLQIADISLGQFARRDQEIGRISRDSKQLAKELGVPFMWISQLSRDAYGVRPEMNMLKESSQIEQDADAVGFIYGKGAGKESKKETFLYFPKQRNGRAGWELPMDFVSEKQMFVTAQLLQMIDASPMSDDERFLQDFKNDAHAQIEKPAPLLDAPSTPEIKF